MTAAIQEKKRVRFLAHFPYFRQFLRTRLTQLPTSFFDDLDVPRKLTIPSFLKFWTCEEVSLGPGDMVPQTGATRVLFFAEMLFFRSRFQPNRGKSWRSESCTSCLNVSSFLKFQTCGSNHSEQGRICAQRKPLWGKTAEFSAQSPFFCQFSRAWLTQLLTSAFSDLGVARKPAIPSFLKFQACKKASLGLKDMVPRTEAAGVFLHDGGSFSNRDFGQTKKALDDLRVARCS